MRGYVNVQERQYRVTFELYDGRKLQRFAWGSTQFAAMHEAWKSNGTPELENDIKVVHSEVAY